MIRFNKKHAIKTRINGRQRAYPQVFVAVLTLAAPGFAVAAQPEDALNFAVGAAYRYEDNLFRIDDDTDPETVAGKSRRSDLISTYNVGIKIDKQYSLQRFQLDLMAIKNDYQTYDYLDFTAKNYRAAWLWSLTPDLTGTVLLSREQVQNNFADFLTQTNQVINGQSVQTNELRSFTADWRVGAGLHLLGGVSEIRSRNDSDFTAVGDYVQRGGEVGVKYVSRADNYISLVQRQSTGDYEGREFNAVSQFDNGFDQRETEVQLNYRLTGKSLIDARLGYVDREHDNFSARDYDGMVGQLAHIWTPTGKLRITTSLSRSLASFQQFFNSYYVADTFAISPVWDLTAKTKIRARYSYSERDYRGALRTPVVAGGIVYTGPLRDDKVHGLTLSAEWQATRALLVTGTLQHETRDSNFDGSGGFNSLDYDANSIGISGQLLF